MTKRPKTRESLDKILGDLAYVMFLDDDAEVQIDSTDVDGDTPLHKLLWQGNTYGVELLLEHGANPNAVGDMGETPLHVAISQSNGRAVAALLKAGADPNVVSEFDETPRQKAARADPDLLALFNRRLPLPPPKRDC